MAGVRKTRTGWPKPLHPMSLCQGVWATGPSKWNRKDASKHIARQSETRPTSMPVAVQLFLGQEQYFLGDESSLQQDALSVTGLDCTCFTLHEPYLSNGTLGLFLLFIFWLLKINYFCFTVRPELNGCKMVLNNRFDSFHTISKALVSNYRNSKVPAGVTISSLIRRTRVKAVWYKTLRKRT